MSGTLKYGTGAAADAAIWSHYWALHNPSRSALHIMSRVGAQNQ